MSRGSVTNLVGHERISGRRSRVLLPALVVNPLALGLALTLALGLTLAPPSSAGADSSTTGQISGTVTLDPPLTATALSLAEVSLWSVGLTQEQPSFTNSAVVGSDGSFTIAGLPPGGYLVATLGAFAPLWYPEAPDPAHAEPVQVLAGQTTAVGDIAEQPGTTVSGTVTNTRGRPVSNAYVEPIMRGSDGSEYVREGDQTDTTGSYVIPDVAAGRWSLSIPFRARYVPTSRVVTTTGFGSITVDFVLRAKRRTTLRALTVRRRGPTLRVSGRTDNLDLFLPGSVRLEFGPPTAPRSRRLGIMLCQRGRCHGRLRLPAAVRRAPDALIVITLPGDRTRTTETVTRSLSLG
jgi:hypothetical protein